MKRQRPSLLAVLALIPCTLLLTCGSSSSATSSTTPSQLAGRNELGSLQNWLKQPNISSNYSNHSHKRRPSQKGKEESEQRNSFSFNTSRANITTVKPERFGGLPHWSLEDVASPLCAYRVIEGGIGGQLCFRQTLLGYKCPKQDCRIVESFGTLMANIFINGSVLLQWSHQEGFKMTGTNTNTKEAADGERSSRDLETNLTREETIRSKSIASGRGQRKGGYELNCWWNGSYTQFECAGVHLGSGCRDFLLTELHENIPYRICLRSLAHSRPAQRAEQRDCVEFTLPPSGMQDIVIAMTTVGGAICVMLVIICLLVAYITENIMSPATHHSYSYHTHSRH